VSQPRPQLRKPPPHAARVRTLADRHPARAVALAQQAIARLPATTPAEHALLLGVLGWALVAWQRFDVARPLLQQAQDALQRHDQPIAVLHCRHGLLLADLQQLTRPDLEPELGALAAQYDAVGAELDAARLRLAQVRWLVALGRPRDAAEVLELFAPTLAAAPPLDRARLRWMQGVVAFLHNDYPRAAELLARAARTFRRLGCRADLGRCWFAQGWAALRQEHLDVALQGYRRAERWFEQLDLPLDRALCAKNSGLAQMMRGAYHQALQATLEALTQLTMLRRVGDIGGCHLHLGNIYFYTGRWDAALACYARAQACYAQAGLIGYGLVAQRNQAMVYRRQGRRAEARALLTAVAAQAQQLGNQLEIAEVQTIEAALLHDEGQLEAAGQRYQHAHDLFRALHNLPAAAEAQLEQGWIAIERGELAAAWDHLQAAALRLEHHPHHRWRVAYGLGRIRAARGDLRAALNSYRTASATVATLRYRLISEEISSSLYLQAVQLHRDALEVAAACGALEVLLEISEHQRALVLRRLLAADRARLPDAYQAAHDRIRHQLSTIIPHGTTSPHDAACVDRTLTAYAELLLQARHRMPSAPDPDDTQEAYTLDLAWLRAQLSAVYGDAWTALSYSVRDQTLLLCVLTASTLTLEPIPFDHRLRQLLDRVTLPRYRSYVYQDIPYLQGQTPQRWAVLHELARRILPPAVQARLQPQHRLLIVPGGPLHALPWAALRLDEGWLAERAIVQVLPSLTAYQALSARPPAAGQEVLLLGCSSFGARAPDLPAVDEELAAVAALWPGQVTLFRDTQATRRRLLDCSASGALRQYALIHIASHAQLLTARGLAAHLKLADGDLYLAEVADLRLDAALVALSACEGASSDVLPGEEVLSLSWALLAAGAGAVLASVWRVNDRSPLRLMTEVYAALRQRRDAPHALASAQRAMIAAHQEDGDLQTSPLAWGGFLVSGVASSGNDGWYPPSPQNPARR